MRLLCGYTCWKGDTDTNVNVFSATRDVATKGCGGSNNVATDCVNNIFIRQVGHLCGCAFWTVDST